MAPEVIGDSKNLSLFEDLINHVRSADDDVRKLTIKQIPSLILESLETKNEILGQLLLVIYNLNTDSEIYESLTIGNRIHVIRHLLRLYVETIKEHQHDQIVALKKLVNYANSSQFLIELANVFYHCGACETLNKEDNGLVEEALFAIRNEATTNLYPEALLMVHSIMALR